MTYVNAPAAIGDMLVACASAVAAGLVSARFHYPAAALAADDGTTADTKPLVVLAEESSERTPYAEIGVAGLPSGSLMATIYSDSHTIGQLETLADDLCLDLSKLSVGLPNVSARRVRASDPTPEERAAGAHRCIDIEISYGLSA
jgi:hypothetical protein